MASLSFSQKNAFSSQTKISCQQPPLKLDLHCWTELASDRRGLLFLCGDGWPHTRLHREPNRWKDEHQGEEKGQWTTRAQKRDPEARSSDWSSKRVLKRAPEVCRGDRSRKKILKRNFEIKSGDQPCCQKEDTGDGPWSVGEYVPSFSYYYVVWDLLCLLIYLVLRHVGQFHDQKRRYEMIFHLWYTENN